MGQLFFLALAGSGSGVSGTGTDNHIPLWDGTGVPAIKDSPVLMNDTLIPDAIVLDMTVPSFSLGIHGNSPPPPTVGGFGLPAGNAYVLGGAGGDASGAFVTGDGGRIVIAAGASGEPTAGATSGIPGFLLFTAGPFNEIPVSPLTPGGGAVSAPGQLAPGFGGGVAWAGGDEVTTNNVMKGASISLLGAGSMSGFPAFGGAAQLSGGGVLNAGQGDLLNGGGRLLLFGGPADIDGSGQVFLASTIVYSAEQNLVGNVVIGLGMDPTAGGGTTLDNSDGGFVIHGDTGVVEMRKHELGLVGAGTAFGTLQAVNLLSAEEALVPGAEGFVHLRLDENLAPNLPREKGFRAFRAGAYGLVARGFQQNIPANGVVPIVLVHNLDSTAPSVTVYDSVTGAMLYAGVNYAVQQNSVNQITVTPLIAMVNAWDITLTGF